MADADANDGLDDADEEELFGDVDDDVDEQELFGSENEDEGPNLNEKDLFGSDDEGKAGPTRHAPSEVSEMDEHDIFGDDSEGEPEKVQDVHVLNRPFPETQQVFSTLRLPNVLSIESKAFRPDSLPQSALEGYSEYTNSRGQQVVKLINPENCIRWRFKHSPEGEVLTDEDGRPQYESNSQVVEWEDGSRTLHVGREVFVITALHDKVAIFEENSQDIHVCHGVSSERLVATPRDLSSATHEMLKRSQYRKIEPTRRSLLIAQDEIAESREMQQMLDDDSRRRMKGQKGTAQRKASKEPALTAGFLEAEDLPSDVAGPSVAGIKRAYKAQGQPKAKKPKPS